MHCRLIHTRVSPFPIILPRTPIPSNMTTCTLRTAGVYLTIISRIADLPINLLALSHRSIPPLQAPTACY